MTNPNEKIIKLSKRLNELGYRQEIIKGNWHIDTDAHESDNVFLWFIDNYPEEQQERDEKKKKVIPIPSLDDGLMWLKERKGFLSLHCGASERWVIESSAERESKDNNIWIVGLGVFADTPHEAVLMAMIKVLEK